MSLRFSADGPLFPAALIDAMLEGDVVFLCGTGVSAPQLPTFKQLVDRVFAALGTPMDASEQRAYAENRFEEVLGSLARRMADPTAVVRAASQELAIPDPPALDQPRTVLRLSRDLNNRVLVVTTNFDTLLEHAMLALEPGADVSAESFAGQALPAPGAAAFGGIIHLHGRLEDQAHSLDATPLVLTSVDYGDAYMRSGWASRFLFDLARCKTIVLLGYSAGDAPVRYFLNVLEADRARFPDLKPVYAFAEYAGDPADAETPWGTVAVTPIAYSKVNPATGVEDHSPLWQDLARLAEIIERPAHERERRLTAVLARPASDLDDAMLAELRWLASGGANPWPVAIQTIEDPRWFSVFQENGLWTADQAEWVVATWIARRWDDRERFLTAIDWQARLGRPFTKRLEMRLGQAAMPPIWHKLWRQLCGAQPEKARALDDNAYGEKAKLESGLVLAQDLERAVRLLSPILILHRPFRGMLFDEEEQADAEGPDSPAEPTRLADVARVEFGCDNDHAATELIGALLALDDHARPILELATAALQAALAQMIDLDLLHDDFDDTDYMVPSVEHHGQNEHHGGVMPLVQLIAATFAKVAAVDPAMARRDAARWEDFPGRIGPRLLLHAMRNKAVFTADEAMGFLLGLDESNFWNIRREIAMLLVDRAADADPAITANVERRICDTGKAFYARYEIRDGQPDWRAAARDNDVWLRLSQLGTAGALSEAGAAELAAIKARRPYLNRKVDDQDFFSSYTYGVRQVVGDIAPITAAAPKDRLDIVREQADSADIEQQHGWGTYCRTDPKGAYATLVDADLNAVNLDLWVTLLSALCFGDETTKALRDDLAVDAVARLAGVGADLLPQIAPALVDAFLFGPRTRFADREDWYDRLWDALGEGEIVVGGARDFANAVLNHVVGRFARVLLQEHEASRAAGDAHLERQRTRLLLIAADQRPAAVYACAMFVQFVAFLTEAIPELVTGLLLPQLGGDGAGVALRTILVTYSSITPLVSRTMPAVILSAVREAPSDAGGTRSIAAVILRPALAELRGDAEPQWGITAANVRDTLREVSGGVRKAVLDLLFRWVRADELGAEQAWQVMARPFLEQVWPKERRFIDAANNAYMAELAIGADGQFPAALDLIRHFIAPTPDGRVNIHTIKSMPAVEQFPRQTLDLLWLLYGPKGRVAYDVPELLGKLIAVDATIEVDRRLQSLLQRAERF